MCCLADAMLLVCCWYNVYAKTSRQAMPLLHCRSFVLGRTVMSEAKINRLNCPRQRQRYCHHLQKTRVSYFHLPTNLETRTADCDVIGSMVSSMVAVI